MFSKIDHPARYRVSQFFLAVRAYLPPWLGGVPRALASEERQRIELLLPLTGQRRLFAGMPPNDQRHALAVARTLQTARHRDPALLQAALLHDVAKSLGQPLPHRVAIVLLEAFWPAALDRLSRWDGAADAAPQVMAARLGAVPAWRRPFVIHAHHPMIGAAWAEDVGCEPVAVMLIARHQDKLDRRAHTGPDHLLALLQWADNLN